MLSNQFQMVATTLAGLEQVLASEIVALGGKEIETGVRSVRFTGDKQLLYKCNYHLRTALRILVPIASFRIFNDKQLYKYVKRVNWEQYMSTSDTFAIRAVTNGAVFRNSKYIALKSKDALVDRFRANHGKRPSVNVEDPDLQVHVHIDDKQCTVALDSTGRSLDKRGYKTELTKAPLSEVLAAGIIAFTGWTGESNFTDPMCGSGTLAIEAVLKAANIPPGKWRGFAFEKWRAFDRIMFREIKEAASNASVELKCKLIASDVDPGAVKIAKSNARRAGVDKFLQLRQEDFLTSHPGQGSGVVVINPPYGERLEETEEMIPFYDQIGTRLKHFYSGWEAWILSSNMRALKHIGLRPSRKIRLFNGALACKLQQYQLYDGSRKRSG